MCCICYEICNWLGILIFLDEESKLSPASSLYSLARDEPVHFSHRVGNVACSVVVWPCYCLFGSPYKPALKMNGARLSKYHK